jgi:hypothetical protein
MLESSCDLRNPWARWITGLLSGVFVLVLAAHSMSQTQALVQPARKELVLPTVLSTRRNSDASLLTILEGGKDELPEGPDAFAVFADGRLAINDPLNHRVAIYSQNGRFKSSIPTKYRPDAINIDDQGRLEIRDSTSNTWYLLALGGEQAVARESDDLQTDKVTLSSDRQNASVTITESGKRKTFLIAALPQPLASVEFIARDTPSTVVLAIEIVAAGDGLNVMTRVRRYRTDGVLISEISDVPNDYYIFPDTAFQVKNSVLYQLQPRKSGVQINIWRFPEDR